MELQFSEQQVLNDLGLSLMQARVYLALVKSGPLKVSAISKIAKIARPYVYPTLSSLLKLGLVEEIIEEPVMYRALPITEGLSLLLKTQTDRYEKVRVETRILLETTKSFKSDENKQLENPKFVFIPEGRTVIGEINRAIESAQLSIDLLLSWKRFSRGIASTFSEGIEKAWRKNVKIRFIVEKTANSKTSREFIRFCREKPSCQVRFIRHQPGVVFGIYDRKEIFIILFSKTDLPSSPALWSNSDALITLASDHFEILWGKAKKRLD